MLKCVERNLMVIKLLIQHSSWSNLISCNRIVFSNARRCCIHMSGEGRGACCGKNPTWHIYFFSLLPDTIRSFASPWVLVIVLPKLVNPHWTFLLLDLSWQNQIFPHVRKFTTTTSKFKSKWSPDKPYQIVKASVIFLPRIIAQILFLSWFSLYAASFATTVVGIFSQDIAISR